MKNALIRGAAQKKKLKIAMKVHVTVQYIFLPRGQYNLYNKVILLRSRCNCVMLQKH